MKKWLIAMVMLLLLPCIAWAETAQDITDSCTINGKAGGAATPDKSRDGNHATFVQCRAMTIEAPEGQQIGAVVLKWRSIALPSVILEGVQGSGWTELQRMDCKYAAQYIPLEEPQDKLRLKADGGYLELCEVQVLTPGEPGPDVQIWRDPPEKVDMMLFSTHPDDEVLWFGGLLPYYAGEQKKDVLVVNAVFGWYYRRMELLDALWTCGVDIYPVFLKCPDIIDTVDNVLRQWESSKWRARDNMVELIRQYKPDVVVLHDTNGEYGHVAHKAFSQLGRQSVERATDPQQNQTSAEKWGTWNVPKTYIHLWGERQLRMDWNQPLAAFDGKTGLEVADAAFQCHLSQLKKQYRVEDGGRYDNALFGLWRTTVGDDLVKNDMFENIPAR